MQATVSVARRRWAWVLTCAAALPLLLTLLLGSTYFFATSEPIYFREQQRNDAAQVVGTDEATLRQINRVVIDYMASRRDSIDMQAEINGEMREVFTDYEKVHMADVLHLFDLLRMALWICVPLFVVLIAVSVLLLPKGMRLFRISKGLLCSMGVCLLLILFGVAIVASDFDRAFTRFHLIFFSNDFWIMDESVHVIYQMMRGTFFLDIAVMIAAGFLGVSVLILMASTLAMIVSSRRLPEAAAPAGQERPSTDEILDAMGIGDESAVPEDVRKLILGEEESVPSAEPPVAGRRPPKPAGEAPTAQELRDRLTRL